MIKLITIDQLDKIMNIYQLAINQMEQQRIYQWDNFYPNKEMIYNDIATHTMYGYFIENELCSVQVINDIQSPEYSLIDWKYIDDNPLILHRLCVAPAYQNQGIGKQMLYFFEKYAMDNQYKTIRFDAYVNNLKSINIYDKLGYVKSGIVQFRKGNFYCFEKKIIPVKI